MIDGYYFQARQLGQLRGLSSLVNRSWFYRRWVVQEVAFAAKITVHCGQSVVSWPEFTSAVSFLHAHHSKLLWVLRTFHIEQDRALYSKSEAGDMQARAAAQFLFVTKDLLQKDYNNRVTFRLVEIETLVMRLSEFQVSDSRDAVYAFFSLA